MKNLKLLSFFVFMLTLISFLLVGCKANDEKKMSRAVSKPQTGEENKLPLPSAASPSVSPAVTDDVIIEVNGTKFTRNELDTELDKRLASAKNQIPAGRQQEAKASIRRQLINDFVARTLLASEVKRLQLKVSESEMTEAMEQLKSSLPPSITIEELIRRNQSTEEKMREEISFGIKINKLVLTQLAGKNKPTEKEIYKFYEGNKDKFKTGESVHVRHILVAIDKKDDDKVKTEKKGKAELLRKQLLEGADFAEIAAKNSDCPSKQSGGDLGLLYRGQSVKPFENAAFSQQVKVVGPVVETEFGYHIIQVLERNRPQQVALDKKIREEIASFIEQQKKAAAFEDIMKKLKAKATVIVHDNN